MKESMIWVMVYLVYGGVDRCAGRFELDRLV